MPSKQGSDRGNRIAFLGFFTSLAVIFGYIDSLLPVFGGVPGIKLGLANLAILIVLYRYGLKEACAVSIVRIFVVGFLFGNLFSIIYSIAGGICSLLMMYFVKTKLQFSMIGVSWVGGVFHNIGQLAAAMAVVESFSLIYYFPALLIAGMLTGVCIGIISREVWKRIEKNIE